MSDAMKQLRIAAVLIVVITIVAIPLSFFILQHPTAAVLILKISLTSCAIGSILAGIAVFYDLRRRRKSGLMTRSQACALARDLRDEMHSTDIYADGTAEKIDQLPDHLQRVIRLFSSDEMGLILGDRK